jgi:hypothetical protein
MLLCFIPSGCCLAVKIRTKKTQWLPKLEYSIVDRGSQRLFANNFKSSIENCDYLFCAVIEFVEFTCNRRRAILGNHVMVSIRPVIRLKWGGVNSSLGSTTMGQPMTTIELRGQLKLKP